MTRSFLIVLALGAAGFLTTAQAENEVVIPDPEIEPPARYVERKLADFRARLDRLKERQVADGPDDFDGDATAKALFKSLAGQGARDLVVNREGDVGVFDLTPFTSSNQVIVTDMQPLSLVSPFGTIYRSTSNLAAVVAVDQNTAAAFSLPPNVSLRSPGSISEVVDDGECCLKFEEKEGDAPPKCIKSVPGYAVKGQAMDLRRVLGFSNIGEGVTFENVVGDDDATLLSIPKPGPGKAVMSFINHEIETAFCGMVYDPSRVRYLPDYKVISVTSGVQKYERSAELLGIEFIAFGLPELDVANAGTAPQLGFFTRGRTTIGSLKMGDAAVGDMPKPVASYFDGPGAPKFDGLRRFQSVVTVETVGISPFIARSGGEIALSPAGVPGGGDVKWSLNDAFHAQHALSLNRVSIEIKGLGRNGALLAGRDYETIVRIEGPVDFSKAGLDITFGGPVGWASGTGQVTRSEGKTEITNRFRPGGDLRPVIEIAMTSPHGEVFTYDAGMIVRGRALGGLDLRVKRGEILSAITSAPVAQIDTFFPSTFPANPTKLSAHASFINDQGDLVSLQKALAQADVGGAFNPQGLLTSSNDGFLKRKRFSLGSSSVFEVSPQIGAALIQSEAGEAGGLARALTGGIATAFAADPVVITSNSLRLLRQNGGFTLSVRGPADMSRYRARWTRRGFAGADTTFAPGDQGAVTTFETKERLAKVEIMEGEEVVATMLGVMASFPAQIRILPFRKVAEVVDKGVVDDFGQLAALKQDCLASGGSRENCSGEQDQAKRDLKETRENQKDSNKFLQKLDRAGKALVELADQMEVAAAIKGAPPPELGETICVWSIIGASDPLKVAQRVTRLRREAAGDFCFNVVTGVKAGFTPGAEIRVELTLLDKGAASAALDTE